MLKEGRKTEERGRSRKVCTPVPTPPCPTPQFGKSRGSFYHLSHISYSTLIKLNGPIALSSGAIVCLTLKLTDNNKIMKRGHVLLSSHPWNYYNNYSHLRHLCKMETLLQQTPRVGPCLSLLLLLDFLQDRHLLYRVVTKMSSCRVNTTSRWGIKQLGISFASIFLLFSDESSQGPCSQ